MKAKASGRRGKENRLSSSILEEESCECNSIDYKEIRGNIRCLREGEKSQRPL